MYRHLLVATYEYLVNIGTWKCATITDNVLMIQDHDYKFSIVLCCVK